MGTLGISSAETWPLPEAGTKAGDGPASGLPLAANSAGLAAALFEIAAIALAARCGVHWQVSKFQRAASWPPTPAVQFTSTVELQALNSDRNIRHDGVTAYVTLFKIVQAAKSGISV